MKTITLSLDETEAALLAELAAVYGKLSTPTSIVRQAAWEGMIRLAVTLSVDVKALGVTDQDLKKSLCAVTVIKSRAPISRS